MIPSVLILPAEAKWNSEKDRMKGKGRRSQSQLTLALAIRGQRKTGALSQTPRGKAEVRANAPGLVLTSDLKVIEQLTNLSTSSDFLTLFPTYLTLLKPLFS